LKSAAGKSVRAATLDSRRSESSAPALAVDLISIASAHDCARHQLFAYLKETKLTLRQALALLRNYDAHASVLRRLLLKAATLMPETAVGYVLENVRTEYGAGCVEGRHQLQLIDLALSCGGSKHEFDRVPIERGTKDFIKSVTAFYYPLRNRDCVKAQKAAVAAGAITATEILAVEEFKAMQIAFTHFGLQNHIWFDHVSVEVDHTDEALALAHHFVYEYEQTESVLKGLNGVLAANISLYDGLLAAMQAALK
jgi:hypothetical protein